jgi:DNA-binding response OmpR family regulator
MRVLVIEDNARMAALIKRVLVAERYEPTLAADGATGIALAGEAAPDAIILDRMLPDMDGTDVVALLRERGLRTPVLMLTALSSVEHRVTGLDAGADDYLPKPFEFEELLARLRALVRRPAQPDETPLTVGDLVLDPDRRVATVGDRSVDLSVREFSLLAVLMRHPGQVLTRGQILEAAWGTEVEVAPSVVDLYVFYLRRHLRVLGRASMLRTVRGVGYSLRAGT